MDNVKKGRAEAEFYFEELIECEVIMWYGLNIAHRPITKAEILAMLGVEDDT